MHNYGCFYWYHIYIMYIPDAYIILYDTSVIKIRMYI